MERRGHIVRVVWAACLLVAALNHASILFRHGLFWDYGGVPVASAAYWSSLTVIDPLVAALLFVRPRAGIVMTVVLIATNVAHNLAITARYTADGAFLTDMSSSPILLSQIGFLLFVGLTARIAWRGARSRTGRRPLTP